jgi:parvulin-like peptidyl-prolyl isomerase
MFGLLLCVVLLTAAQGPAAGSRDEELAAVAASVNGVPVLRGEVERLYREAFGRQQIAPQAVPRFQALALRQAVDRILVLQAIQGQGGGATAAEVEKAIAQFQEQLERQKLPWNEYLRTNDYTPETFRREVTWQLNWNRYSARQLTDDVLRRTFDAQRRQFDGTQVRVSHLLLKLPADASPQTLQELLDRAADIRRQIDAGLDFAQAVARYSDGTRDNGGDLGFIQRRGDMPEAFSQAAFALSPGGISAPVVTPVGVHLIRCTQVRPGTRSFDDARAEVELHARQELFERLAASQRPAAEIRYTGTMPYFDPASGRLVTPR